VSQSGRSTRLYLARWPDGATTVLSAESLEHAVDLIDEIDNPQECEVVPFDGNLWLTLRPSDDPANGPLVLCHRPTIEIDSQREIVAAAFPVLSKLVEGAQRETDDGDIIDEDIDPERWREAKAIEADRILAPSSGFREAIEHWWDALGPNAEPHDHD
jgi:hypothetical protein